MKQFGKAMNRPAVTGALLLMATSGALSQVSTKPYAQLLVDEIVLRHANVSMLAITVKSPTNGKEMVLASNTARRVSDHNVKNPDEELAITRLNASDHGCQALVPLHDAARNVIGTMRAEVTSKRAFRSGCRSTVEELRDELSQVIPSSQDLFDPYIVSTSSGDLLAQRLTIETLVKYPEVLVLALHVTAPGDSVNRVVGINRPKFLGRMSDEVDQEVAKTGKTIVQLVPATHRMEIHMPLRTADGSLAGALVTVYLWQKEAEMPMLLSRSMRIRDKLQPRIPSVAALVNRAP